MTNITTLELNLRLTPALQEVCIAALDAAGFTGFVQDAEVLKAYIPLSLWTQDLKKYVQDWLHQHEAPLNWTEAEIAPRDWNKAWEASIQPIHISPFYVRPSWATPLAGAIDLVVDPKMSFGTGHHETTRLLLKMMPKYVTPDSRVLDAGTGTGVLAIAAIKLKAASAIAFDFDPWVSDNVLENLKLNAVTQFVTYREGTLDVVPEEGFDVVLANINRNVLLDYLAGFANKVNENGYLFLSGVLVEDRDFMEKAAGDVGLRLIADDREGAWWAGVFVRLVQ